MSEPHQDHSTRQAAEELQRYLSDEIAPMMAVEYFEQLLPQPPIVTAKIIAHWVQSQHAGPGSAVTTSDLVFHAMKKLSLLSELELVRRATMMRTIHEISRVLVQACPETQRDELRMRLSHLGEGATVLASRAEFLHREAEAAAADAAAGAGPTATAVDAPPAPDVIDHGAKVLTLLLGELSKLRTPEEKKGKNEAKDGPEAALLAQILATAALESKTNEDLARHLERVKKEGIATPMGQVFRALGWSLPGWGTLDDKGKPIDAATGRQLQAMNRIVALAPDPQERAKRWGEMIYAAIEQLNEGRLAQSVSILEVATRVIAEKRPDATIVGQVLSQAEGAISDEVLRKIADVPAKHGLLRKVLEFFPSFRPDALLTRLDGEIRREKRKLLLTLIECHGSGCRDLVLTRLATMQDGEDRDPEGFYTRNLAFLLRRIPRVGHDRVEEEIDRLTAMIAPGQPTIAAKEAAGALGQLRQAPAEAALIERLRQIEGELTARGGNAESWELLDRICAGLARHGGSRGVRAIAAHAWNRSPAMGDALARFEHLSRVDLSVDAEQLDVLLKAMRDLAPAKVLGFVSKKGHHELACLMQAVSGTPAQEVRSALEGIAERFQGHPLGEQAAKTLAKLEPRARASAEALAGDLDVFGLPNLLQSLTDTKSSGELVLFDARQTRRGAIVLAKGRVVRCEAGRLSGAEAVYLVMEKPFSGTFAFRASAEERAAPAISTFDPMSLILEGARRHDEYKQGCAFAPDGVRYEPAGGAATRPEDEDDAGLAASVWERAAAGVPADVCEADAKVDPFRVRRLYAHWVESGVLRPRT